jgi:hypothetical protein
MITRITRGLVAAAGALAVAGAALVAAPAASATGTLTLTPDKGSGETAFSVTTTGGCANATATHYVITLSGRSLKETINLGGLQPLSAIPALSTQTTPMTIAVPYTFERAQESYGAAIPTGVYDVKVICRAATTFEPITVYTGKVTLRQVSGGLSFENGAKPTAVTNTAKPRIAGKGNVGATLRVTQGTWAPKPDRTTVVWRIGKKTVGTGAAYKVKRGDRGKTITAVVTATKSGLLPGTASATIRIAK